ncbi:hypothetical protein DLAC_08187 [Tieghemostelium lacteum]|uniref:Uncharacterized protein n=1 Tax=Tieghemostelium lacteum TaxID=361077 RepID=A0A151ZBJ5_TIELA|nr:hypothetical protein DLAC_08187 [Tieghemostelium lacteum]|eukprot:KYQ91254.1 hypothetical protein DLAC_08187 [Tieghemostelium lacteum]
MHLSLPTTDLIYIICIISILGLYYLVIYNKYKSDKIYKEKINNLNNIIKENERDFRDYIEKVENHHYNFWLNHKGDYIDFLAVIGDLEDQLKAAESEKILYKKAASYVKGKSETIISGLVSSVNALENENMVLSNSIKEAKETIEEKDSELVLMAAEKNLFFDMATAELEYSAKKNEKLSMELETSNIQIAEANNWCGNLMRDCESKAKVHEEAMGSNDELIHQLSEKYCKAVMVFQDDLDMERADYQWNLDILKKQFSNGLAQVELSYEGRVDLLEKSLEESQESISRMNLFECSWLVIMVLVSVPMMYLNWPF